MPMWSLTILDIPSVYLFSNFKRHVAIQLAQQVGQKVCNKIVHTSPTRTMSLLKRS